MKAKPRWPISITVCSIQGNVIGFIFNSVITEIKKRCLQQISLQDFKKTQLFVHLCSARLIKHPAFPRHRIILSLLSFVRLWMQARGSFENHSKYSNANITLR